MAEAERGAARWADWYVHEAATSVSAAASAAELLQRRDLSSLVARARERRRELDSSSTAILQRARESSVASSRRAASAVEVVGAEMSRLSIGTSSSSSSSSAPSPQQTAAAAAARRREYENARRQALAAELAAHPERFGTTSRRAPTLALPPLPTDALDALPTFTWSDDHASRECTICTHNFAPGEVLIRLPCSDLHCFHRPCIAAWLSRQASCPLCRCRLGGGTCSGAGGTTSTPRLPERVPVPAGSE